MIPFLKLFGVEKGNGLSPLAVKIDTPADLSELITQFFKPLKTDSRVKKRVPNGDAPMPDTTNTGSQDDTNDNDDPVFVGMVDGEELEPPASIVNVEENAPPPPVNVIAAHVKEINYLKQKEAEGTEDCDCEYDFIGEEEETLSANNQEPTSTIEEFFFGGNTSQSYLQFKLLLKYDKLEDVVNCELKLMELLQLEK